MMVVPWHESLKQILEQGISQGRLGQTLLFESDSSISGYDLSNWLVKRLLCQSESQIKPCGHCHSCHMIEAATHPDRFEVTTETNTIGVDDIRELTDWSVQRPRYGQAKVALIMPADKLTVSAANALLKILEEPNYQNYFILIKPFQSALLPTIVSRTQRFVIPLPSQDEAVQWLKGNFHEMTSHDLLELLDWISDDPIEVQSFLSKNGLEVLRLFKKAIDAVNAGQIELLQKTLEEHHYMLHWLGKIMIHSMQQKYLFSSDSQSKRLRSLSKQQLMTAYQQYIQLSRNLKDNPSLNYSMQLYPLLSKLIPRNGDSRAN
ncbi:MAG: hypothetical protein CENE_03374 [Candidatus Celerinatantimonas neptuna]|nr:MAG: hypothetical protein CENE_03374 [Candidatus Celerinatantimonas neptuna]